MVKEVEFGDVSMYYFNEMVPGHRLILWDLQFASVEYCDYWQCNN